MYASPNSTWPNNTPLRGGRQHTEYMSETSPELDGLRDLDPHTISAIHKRYFLEIFRYARYRLSNESIAEDIAGEAFTRLLESVPGRKAIIVLTDGMDNSSTATLEATIAQIGESGLSISAIGLGDSSKIGTFAGLNEARLESLAGQAGGVYSRTADAAELRRIYERLGRALHSEYVITYSTAMTLRDGVNRTLDVRLASSAASASRAYNPGGVVPEVAQPASWPLFGLVLAGLAALLLLPDLFRLGVGAARNLPVRARRTTSRGRVRLNDEARPADHGRIRLR